MVAADPSAKVLADAKTIIEENKKQVDAQIKQLKSTADDKQAELLKMVEDDYDGYLKKVDDTFELAGKVGGGIELSAAQKSINDTVRTNHGLADALATASENYTKFSDEHSNKITEEAAATVKKAKLMMILVSVIGVIGGTAFGYLLASFGIGKPLALSIGNINTLSKGNTDVTIAGTDRKDELGEIASALQVFKDNLIDAERLRKEQAAAQQKQLDRSKKVDKLVAGFEKGIAIIVGLVSSASTELQSTAESMAATAEETSKQSNTVAAAAEEATANVQTVASATEELSASVKEIQSSVHTSNGMVIRASEQAAATNEKVKDLASASQKIGDVVQLINDIAAQTNLLALNATIEAARAGDAGKGFAVVASEVKALAGQTAKATDEIAKQVQGIQLASGSSAEAIQQIAAAIEEVKKTSSAISAAVEEQGSATQEIARNVNEAATGTKEVSSNIASVREAAQHTGASATQVLSAAGELARNGEKLRIQVEDFLREVRAA
jgi:methyl-accepting chemotaxis protein